MKILTAVILFTIFLTFTAHIFAQGTAPANTGGGNTFNITRPQLGFGIDISGNGSDTGNLGLILKNVVILFFTVGALAFTIMIIWGAVSWILSGGDKEQVAGARKRITTAITGLVILSLSFVIMVAAGQILGINALQFGDFKVPGLGAP